MKKLSESLASVLQRIVVVSPIGPADRNWSDGFVQHADLPQILQHLSVFVVLNAVTNGFQTDPGADSVEAIGAGG